jgi:hypothetical protein
MSFSDNLTGILKAIITKKTGYDWGAEAAPSDAALKLASEQQYQKQAQGLLSKDLNDYTTVKNSTIDNGRYEGGNVPTPYLDAGNPVPSTYQGPSPATLSQLGVLPGHESILTSQLTNTGSNQRNQATINAEMERQRQKQTYEANNLTLDQTQRNDLEAKKFDYTKENDKSVLDLRRQAQNETARANRAQESNSQARLTFDKNTQRKLEDKDYREASKDYKQAQTKLDDITAQADDILKDTNGLTTTGNLNGVYGWFNGSKTHDFNKKVDSFKNGLALTLAKDSKLTPMSDSDVKILQNSYANLDTTQSPESFEKNVQTVKYILGKYKKINNENPPVNRNATPTGTSKRYTITPIN